VNIIEELAPVTDDPSTYADPYTVLKERLLAAYGCSKWEKLDSLLSFPKMGAHERPSMVLARLNTLKPASLEELYIAIYLRVLPDGYREHFSRCQFKTAEELAAVADGLWEIRGGNPAVVAATRPSWRLWAVLPPLGDTSRLFAISSSSIAAATSAVATGEAVVAATAATAPEGAMVAALAAGIAPPPLGGPS
jgi:hypothetical protein